MVPLMIDASESTSPLFLHLRNIVCPLPSCRRKGRSKVHSLITKAQPLCLHTILAYVANIKPKKEAVKQVEHQIDYKLTVKYVIKKVRSDFPPNFRELEDGNFLTESRVFVNQLYQSGDEMDKNLPNSCDLCKCDLEVWKRKPPVSYLMTLGGLKKISIPVRRCPSCHCAYYPDLYTKGVICLHNSVMVSVDYLLDMINALKSSSSMIETIQARIRLAAKADGLDVDEIDVSNLSIKLEKSAIALAAVLIKEVDLDLVCCYLCGVCPKLVSSGMYYIYFCPNNVISLI